tara:strand:+ start:4427 stop:4612 length:186 start_codon:yes stop_codon:yes gene_type:complete
MENDKLKLWSPSHYLEDREDMILYLNACIEEDPGDGSLIRAALSDIARAQKICHAWPTRQA